MKEFSVPMALIDYVPVFLFLFGMTTIIDDLKDKANKALMFVLSVGTDLIVVAGLLKATYKLQTVDKLVLFNHNASFLYF